MSYGMKRWSMGYLLGISMSVSFWSFSAGWPHGYAFVGLSIALFFGDYLIASRERGSRMTGAGRPAKLSGCQTESPIRTFD